MLPGRENPRTPSEVVAGERRGENRGAATPLAQAEQEAQEQAAPPVSADEPKLALIDFGMTARLPEQLRDNIVRLLLDLSENKGDSAAETMIELGAPTDRFDRSGYTREIAQLIAQNANLSIADIQAGTVLYEMISLSFQHGLRMPAELTLLAKALFNLDAVSRSLDPSFSPIDAIRDYTTQLANDRAKRDLSPRRMFQVAMETSDLIGALPRRLDLITQRFASNDFAVKVDVPEIPILLNGMQKIANRVFTGLVLAGLLISSGMLLPYWRTIGTIGFAISAAIALWMIATILISDRKEKK